MYNGNMTAKNCSTQDCAGGGRLKRGLCPACYQWSRKNGGADPAGRPFRPHTKRIEGETCTVVEDGVRCGGAWSRGTLCNKHRLRKSRYGDPMVQKHASPGDGMSATEYTKRRRALKLSAFVEDVETEVVVSMHGRWCYLCESTIRLDESMHMDHVEPLSKGGPHSYANVRPAHGYCNLSKKDRHLHELDLPFVPPRLLVGA